MTREKEIYKAAEDYAYTESPYETVSSNSFIAGALWADHHKDLSALWHDASEEPKGTYIILCRNNDNDFWVVDWDYTNGYYISWQDYSDVNDVKSWAYISDLLPKGGEK